MKQKRLLTKRRLGFKPLLPLLLAAAMLYWLIVGALGVSTALDSQRLEQLTATIRRYVVQCYALEGRYPDSLDYLEKNYSLTLDRERYVYHYQNLGANILPQIAVFALNTVQ